MHRASWGHKYIILLERPLLTIEDAAKESIRLELTF
jgi:hypothetical protein